MVVLILVALVAMLAAALFFFLDRRYSTWQRKGVPGPPASALGLRVPKIILGEESMGDIADRIYKEYRQSTMAGSYLFCSPLLHLIDPEVIKHVLIKEFQDFSGRGTVEDLDYDPMSRSLFFLSGQRWRKLRVKLAPTFTSGKIKYMFDAIRQCSQQMADYLEERVTAGGGKHCEDARPLMMRLFVDIIASVAFGIESNVVKTADSEFFRAAEEAVEPTRANALRALLSMFGRRLMTALRIHPNSANTRRFFTDIVHESVAYREENKVERADMLSLLIQLKNDGFVAPDKEARTEDREAASGGAALAKSKLTMEDIVSNVFIFFLAGFESSAGTTSFTLYEMAKNPEILERALREVDQAMADFDGKITYETIMSMPYLEKCVNETLRMYPPLSFVSREAMVTRKVPLTNVVVEKGTRIVIPIRALHYDPVYWPDPERYDPERFNEEQKAQRPAMAFLPFGDGPRICIAARLGVVQIKTALVTLLSKYTVSVTPGTPQRVTINPRSFATTAGGGLNITFHPRSPTPDIVKRRTSIGG